MSTYAQTYWQQRFANDQLLLEQQRLEALQQIREATSALRQRWPGIKALWLLGSLLGAGFHSNSDIDLLVEGLAAEDVLHALALAEAFISRPVDLKRAEDLGQELCQRLLRTSEAL